MINFGLRRIQVLGTFLIIGHDTAAKSYNLTGQIPDRKHHPRPETVKQAPIRLYCQTGFY